jgi:hypothetical protein
MIFILILGYLDVIDFFEQTNEKIDISYNDNN